MSISDESFNTFLPWDSEMGDGLPRWFPYTMLDALRRFIYSSLTLGLVLSVAASRRLGFPERTESCRPSRPIPVR